MLCITLSSVLILSGCQTEKTSSETTAQASSETASETVVEISTESDEESGIGYAVATSTKEATKAGMDILAAGGNAIDAAAAISFALGVTEPNSSGIGGCGILLVYDSATGKAWSLDYYASSGAASSSTDKAGIPGLVKGMDTALKQWGTMSLSEVLQPAIDLAEKGFKASDAFVSRLGYYEEIENSTAFKDVKTGSTVIQEDLANSLKLIQEQGADAMYTGQLAEDIAAATELTVEDMANYQVYETEPVTTTFYGYTLYAAAPPASGITLLQMLKMAEIEDIADPAEDTASYLDTLALVTSKAYTARKSIVFDPRFYPKDYEEYLSTDYLKSLIAGTVSLDEPSDDNEKLCTTQFSVIDGNGLTVVCTNTLSDNWGSAIYVDGFYMNNSLSNFGTTGKNKYEPNKRPRTFFSPVIAVGPDGFILATGSPGGNVIPRATFGVVNDILRNGEDVQTAVNKDRVFFDDDGKLCVETEFGSSSLIDKSAINYSYYYDSSHLSFGCTSVVGYSPTSGVFAAADMRRSNSGADVHVTKR